MAQIIDIHGNPLQREVLTEPQTSRLGTLHREFAEHPSRGLTPVRLARILEAAEQGNLQAQADLFADIEEKDAHIFSEMAKRKNAILNIPWSIVPPKNASAQEKNDAEWMNEVLSELDGFEDFLLGMMDGIGYGYSNTEIEWELNGKLRMPKALHHRPASWFCLAQDKQDELRLRTTSADGEPLWSFGWIKHVHRAKTGYIARCGLHRVLAWPYLFKNYGIRDLAELLEIYGIPLRLGKYPSGTGEKEKATLLRAVTALGHSAAGIIPEGMSIEFEAIAAASHDPFMALVDWAERSVSKAVLGGTLTSQADGKTSTNALGNVHNEVRIDLRTSDARQIAATVKRDLIYSIYVLNRGPVTDIRRLPTLEFDTVEPEDLKMYADALPSLVSIGMEIPANWVHGKLAIPKRNGDEPVLTRAAQPLPAGTKLSALAALLERHGIVFPDQAGIDAAIDNVPSQTMQQQAEQFIAPLLADLDAADSPDAQLGILAEAFPSMSPDELQTALGNMMFIARLVGMHSAQTED